MGENGEHDIDLRRRIYNLIQKSPGLHLRELSRKLEIPLTTLDYHLFYLKRRGMITARLDGKYVRYFVEGSMGIEDTRILSILRQKVCRTIIMFLLLNKQATHRDICEHIKRAPSTTTFHLKKLVELHLISANKEGREIYYAINDVDALSDALVAYKKGFFDTAVNQFVSTWLELNPSHVKKKKKKKD